MPSALPDSMIQGAARSPKQKQSQTGPPLWFARVLWRTGNGRVWPKSASRDFRSRDREIADVERPRPSKPIYQCKAEETVNLPSAPNPKFACVVRRSAIRDAT